MTRSATFTRRTGWLLVGLSLALHAVTVYAYARQPDRLAAFTVMPIWVWGGRGFGFAATHIIDVLRGKASDKVRKFGHDKLSTFGIGADLAEADWRLLLRQLIARHLVDVDFERFNVLSLTEASRTVLRGEDTIELRRQFAAAGRRPNKGKADAAGGLDAAARALFERLREWRASVAREHGVPAYVVFHDGTLQSIALARPASIDQLRMISGIGERKLENYGTQLLALVAQH